MTTADQIDAVGGAPPQNSWQSRIVGYGEERPDQLLAHPENWRIHTRSQRAALTQLLDKVGWVQNVIVNKRTEHVLDGHLRVGEAISRGEDSVPVTYVDLDEEEERLVLASLDPIAALAQTDSSSLIGLLSSVDVGGDLERLLRTTAGMADGVAGVIGQDEIDKRQSALENSMQGTQDIIEIECPHCGGSIGLSRSDLARKTPPV